MTITNYQDLIYQIRITDKVGNVIRLVDVNDFTASFFTDNEAIAASCHYSNNDISNVIIQEDRDLCNINSIDLEKMTNGILKYKYQYSIIDSSFQDGFFDAVIQGETNYYLNVKSSSSNLDNYYTKGEVYNKIEIDDIVENIETGGVDLSNYYDKTQTNDLLLNKVDKVDGKDLSSNDYTTLEKNKLNSLENYDDSIITNLLNSKSDKIDTYTKSDVYNKNEIDTKFNDIEDVDLTYYYNKVETNDLLNIKVDKEDGKDLSSNDYTTLEKNKLNSLENYDDSIITNLINTKSDKSETYSKNEVYNKIEIDTKFNDIETGDVDLTNYYNKPQTDNLLNTKVDKVNGKDLSTNDFTTLEKNKLNSLENYDDSIITNLINTKSDKSDTYSKNEVYDKIEIDTKFENIDDTDLTNYYNKLETNDLLNNKVDKVTGKDLSSNDFTTTEKDKLNSLENYDDTSIINLINTKQNTLTAGENISINNNVISSIDTIYDDTSINNRISTLEGEIMNVDVALIALNNITN